MTRLLRAAVLLVAILALAGATGCFGSNSDENAYVDQLSKVQNDFASSVAKAKVQNNSASSVAKAQAQGSAPSGLNAKAQAIQNFDTLEKANDKLIADLKAVDPPAKVESLHNGLISEMQQFQVHVKKAAASFTASDGPTIEAALAQFTTELGQFGTKISKTITGINDKLQE
jgi:hypothetical protein